MYDFHENFNEITLSVLEIAVRRAIFPAHEGGQLVFTFFKILMSIGNSQFVVEKGGPDPL